MQSKPWYLSKTVWVNILAAIALVVAHFSPTVSNLIKQYFSEVGSAWVVVNLVLRWLTKGKIEISAA